MKTILILLSVAFATTVCAQENGKAYTDAEIAAMQKAAEAKYRAENPGVLPDPPAEETNPLLPPLPEPGTAMSPANKAAINPPRSKAMDDPRYEAAAKNAVVDEPPTGKSRSYAKKTATPKPEADEQSDVPAGQRRVWRVVRLKSKNYSWYSANVKVPVYVSKDARGGALAEELEDVENLLIRDSRLEEHNWNPDDDEDFQRFLAARKARSSRQTYARQLPSSPYRSSVAPRPQPRYYGRPPVRGRADTSFRGIRGVRPGLRT
jgi:hypothetical protein